MFRTIARDGNYYVIDMDTGLRVSPSLPNNIQAEQFLKMVEFFGPPSVDELLDPSFDYRAWMLNKKNSAQVYGSTQQQQENSGWNGDDSPPPGMGLDQQG